MSLFFLIAGYIIGLGAVTVIDVHGFLGRKSSYWTVATTRAHKVTKPLIWIGTILVLISGILFYDSLGYEYVKNLHILIFSVLILNGCYLTFGVSRHLLKREKEGKDAELLSFPWQLGITISFLISFMGWWSSVYMLTQVLLI